MAKRDGTGQAGLSGRTTTERHDFHGYEEEKKKLRTQGLSPEEYQRRVRELAERMGL